MKLEVLLGNVTPHFLKIRSAIERLAFVDDVSFHNSVAELLVACAGQLTFPHDSIVVFAPGSVHDLDAFAAGMDRVREAPLVLILPVCSPELIAKGHKLRPRAFFCGLANPHEVAAVLGSMAGRIARNVPAGLAKVHQ